MANGNDDAAAKAAADAAAKEAAARAALEAEEAKKGHRKAGAKGQMIKVVGPAIGRRRAGMKFTPEGVDIDLSTITADQLAAIDADPELKITRP